VQHTTYELNEKAYVENGINAHVPYCNAILETCLVLESTANDTYTDPVDALKRGIKLLTYNYKKGTFEVLADLGMKKYTETGYDKNVYYIKFKDETTLAVSNDTFEVLKNYKIDSKSDDTKKDLLIPKDLQIKQVVRGGEGFSIAYYKIQIYRNSIWT